MPDTNDSKKRVMIFVDAANLRHSLINALSITDENSKEQILFNLDIKSLGHFLAGERNLKAIHYYTAPLIKSVHITGYPLQQSYLNNLSNSKIIRVHKAHMMSQGSGKYKIKGDDVMLAVDMVKLAYNNAYDIAILISNDGDFYPAISAVKEKGKIIENAYFMKARASALGQYSNISIRLDNNIEKFINYPPPTIKSQPKLS